MVKGRKLLYRKPLFTKTFQMPFPVIHQQFSAFLLLQFPALCLCENIQPVRIDYPAGSFHLFQQLLGSFFLLILHFIPVNGDYLIKTYRIFVRQQAFLLRLL